MIKKKVVVIGGGFAGSLVAKKLERKFDVILTDTKNYFEFTPGILRTIVQPEHISKIQVLHSHYLRRAKILIGEVREVSENYIKIKNKKIKFDYLAICSGSNYKIPVKEQGVIIAARAKHLHDCYKTLCRAEKILIIGGGVVGVELAGEILWRYGDKKEITIAHSGNALMERNHPKSREYAGVFLKRRGVKIIYNERIIKTNKKIFITDKGREIKTDMAFLCTGIAPNYKFMKKHFSSKLNEKNQIMTDDFLLLDGADNIFAAGDVSSCNVEKTAQNAEKQARTIVKNICFIEQDREMIKYSAEKTPMVISLGKYRGIFEHKNFVLTGIIPAFMKQMIEKWEMAKKRRIYSERYK